jgi:hypothetical protein
MGKTNRNNKRRLVNQYNKKKRIGVYSPTNSPDEFPLQKSYVNQFYNGTGNLTFWLTNARENYEFRYFTNNTKKSSIKLVVQAGKIKK